MKSSRSQLRGRTIGQSLVVAGGATLCAAVAARAIMRSKRYFDLRGRTVVITGGSRGLGLNLARQCIDRGANVAIGARDRGELERASVELAERRGSDSSRVFARPCDVREREHVAEFINAVRERFSRIDVLINGAGVIQVGPMEEMTFADYDEAIATHLLGPLYMTTAVLPAMRERRSGRIVNIASIGGKLPAPHLLPYTASKHALVGFSEGLRVELAKHNIFVTTVIPGLFRSGSPRNAIFKGRNDAEYAWFATGDAMPGLSMNVQRLARQIVSAMQHGDAELITPFLAMVQAKAFALMPNFCSEIITMIDRLLPKPGGIGTDRARGYESEGAKTPPVAQRLNDRAAAANNEIS